MKRFSFTMLQSIFIIGFSQLALAQDVEPSPTNNVVASPELNVVNNEEAAQKSVYIRDFLFVPLRSGESSTHRIVHKGLKSGTEVTLIQTNEESGYSQIKTSRGKEGWLKTQYIQEQPTANILLRQAQATIEQLSSKAGPMSEKLIAIEQQNQKLNSKLKQSERKINSLNKELERIKGLSENQITLDEKNKELMQQNQLLKNKKDTLDAENQHLENELKHEGFMNGTLAVILGMIATLVIQYMTRSRKRSDWA